MGGVGSGEEKSSALCFQMGIGEDGEEGLSTCGHSGPVNERRFHSHRHGAVSCHLALTNPFPTTGNKPFPPVKYSSPSLPSSVAFFKKVSFSWGISSFSSPLIQFLTNISTTHSYNCCVYADYMLISLYRPDVLGHSQIQGPDCGILFFLAFLFLVVAPSFCCPSQ